jgi:UDP-glucuronate 4-epimerase
LVELGHSVTGIDNLNDYYNVNLKIDRLSDLGIEVLDYGETSISTKYPSLLSFIKVDIEDKHNLFEIFKNKKFDVVCNLAAQAGVRYSLKNPFAYIQSNIVGFLNVLEACKEYSVPKIVYASSSSVYGLDKDIPFRTAQKVDAPISLYAATKISNELMAYTYSHLYGIETIGLRFFTVYGPWGRPDMAMFLFTDAILNGQPVEVYNNGELSRDFTYIDDSVNGVILTIEKHLPENNKYALYNIGNGAPVNLLDFILTIEAYTGFKAKKNMLPMQDGDVVNTWADTSALERDVGYKSKTSVKEGVARFIDWYRSYFKI